MQDVHGFLEPGDEEDAKCAFHLADANLARSGSDFLERLPVIGLGPACTFPS